MLATGAVVVMLFAAVNFRGDLLRGWLRSDTERIQGTWKTVSITKNGRARPDAGQVIFIFDGESLRAVKAPGDQTVSYHLDEGHQPGWIDINDDRGLVQGIYEVSGATLRLCLNNKSSGKRPISFESKAGSGDSLWVLQRE